MPCFVNNVHVSILTDFYVVNLVILLVLNFRLSSMVCRHLRYKDLDKSRGKVSENSRQELLFIFMTSRNEKVRQRRDR